MAIELSPIIAQDIEAAARRSGVQGILDFFAVPDTWSPMYLREEAQFLAAVIQSAPGNDHMLWGFDREIFSDRYLINRLEGGCRRGRERRFAAPTMSTSSMSAP